MTVEQKQENQEKQEKSQPAAPVTKPAYQPYICATPQALEKRRSPNYLGTITLLDQQAQTFADRRLGKLKEILAKDFADLPLYPPSDLVAIIAPCVVSNQYEVLVVDFNKDVLKYYEKNSPDVPAELEKFRYLAASGYYVCVEVYDSCVCAVNKTGFASVHPFKESAPQEERTKPASPSSSAQTDPAEKAAAPAAAQPQTTPNQRADSDDDDEDGGCAVFVILFLMALGITLLFVWMGTQ